MSAPEFVWLKAEGGRARTLLPLTAVPYVETMPRKLGEATGRTRYVWRIPATDFDPSILNRGYYGKVSRARVNEDAVRMCW